MDLGLSYFVVLYVFLCNHLSNSLVQYYQIVLPLLFKVSI